jgi:hypothetical protein
LSQAASSSQTKSVVKHGSMPHAFRPLVYQYVASFLQDTQVPRLRLHTVPSAHGQKDCWVSVKEQVVFRIQS